jgi:hypothetical protein
MLGLGQRFSLRGKVVCGRLTKDETMIAGSQITPSLIG